MSKLYVNWVIPHPRSGYLIILRMHTSYVASPSTLLESGAYSPGMGEAVSYVRGNRISYQPFPNLT